MRPAYKSPEPITEKNFHEHLGNEDFYAGYLDFFSDVLLDKGAAATLEEYIFSPKANIIPPAKGAPPMQMANRFVAGLLHPLIHTGYGAEFGLLGIFAEGLAQTSVHAPSVPSLIPSSLGGYASAATSDVGKGAINALTSMIPSLVLDPAQRLLGKASTNSTSPAGDVHALTIFGRLLDDPAFAQSSLHIPPPPEDDEAPLARVLREKGDELCAIAGAWTVDGTNAGEVARKIEELVWLNVIIYGVCGWGSRHSSTHGRFNADFTLMHLVTSVLFLPSLVAYLSPMSTAIFLRTYLVNSLATWVSRGRPVPPLQEFFSEAGPTATPVEHDAKPSSAKDTLVPSNPSPNAWLPILQTTLMHPDEHLCKLQRALAHFASLYGTTEKGSLKGIQGLPGAKEIDGSLFVRTAGLTADALGWMREGEERKMWDFSGYFD